MSSIAIEIVVVLALLLLNGVFAMSELAIVSARKVRLERHAEAGDAGARAALRLAEKPADFLSAVQVGITLVGVLSGAVGGATIAESLAERFVLVPAIAHYAEALALGIVVAAIAYLSLIIGELVPKRIALNNPERIAARMARPMRLVARAASPLVTLLTASSSLVLRLLRVRTVPQPVVTEEEIRALVEDARESGAVQAAEQEIVESVFRLGDRQVGTIMTPRPDMEWIDLDDPPARIREQLAGGRQRFVLARDRLDRVVGIVQAENLLPRLLAPDGDGTPFELPRDLEAAAWQPLFVPESMPAFQLLDTFKQSGQHVALVLDEYGGVQGIVALADILEALVGEIPRQAAEMGPEIVRRPDGSWLVDGGLPVDEMEARLGTDPIPMDERRGFRTLAGFIMTRLGQLPAAGDVVEWAGYRLEVMDMDGRRIDKVLVVPPKGGGQMADGRWLMADG
jgi:putative hemolysin